MIPSVYIAVVSVLFSVNIEFDQDIFELMNRVDTDTILQTISDISGEEAVTIGGVPDSIPCRYAITEGAHKAARWLAGQLEAEGVPAEVVSFEVDPSSIGQELPIGTTAEELKTIFNPSISATKPYTMWNVVGTLPGNDSLEILLTAHYDAISEIPWDYTPGADDNASGVAGVMEAARILSDQDLKHTVKFVLFGGEELGLFGSKYYVNQVADAEAEDMILGVLNLDMMAYEGNGIPEVDIHCHPWLEESAEQAEMLADIIDVYGLDLIADIHTKDATTRSDHASFWPELIPAMLLIEDYFGGDSTPFYHTTDDRISTLDTEYLTEGVKASVVWTATMAQSDAFNPAIMENPYPDEVILIELTTHQTDAIVWMDIKTPYRITPAVYNKAGQKVKEFTPVSPSGTRQRIRLDLSGLGAGVYWIGVPGAPVEKFVLIR